MINRHNSFCGCNYCEILESYVLHKKYLHKKMQAASQIEFYIAKDEADYLGGIRKLEDTIQQLKTEKDKLKSLA